MPPKRTTAHARAQSIAALSPKEPFTPAPDAATFRDLLIFEERLKQNALRLQSRKRKYEVLLTSFIAFILWISYFVWLQPREQVWLQYALSAVLMICMVTLFLFFASGMHAERIRSANKFVPQSNRSLRGFNMYLNTRVATSARWWSWLPFLTDSPNHKPTPSKSTTNGSSSSLTTQRRAMLAGIPPSQNTRGELIFSTKVDTDFREGYEKYRAAFERRRAEKMAAKRALSWKRWLDRIWPRSTTGTLQIAPASTGSRTTHRRSSSSAQRTGHSRNQSTLAMSPSEPPSYPKQPKSRTKANKSSTDERTPALVASSASETEPDLGTKLEQEHEASSASELDVESDSQLLLADDEPPSAGSSLSGHDF